MYNGIGLQTTRGSGTNGYVQRNLGFVRVNKETVEYKPDEDVKKLEAYISKKGNAELLKHDRKRKIEVKCLEMEEMMNEQGFDIKYTNNSIKKNLFTY
jgi:serine/arginine repetitive matrix protein 2